MKKRFVLTGIISMLLVIGMVLAGCDNGTTGGGNNSYTDIPIPANIQTVTGALDWISKNAVDWGAYTITVKAGETIQGRGLNYGNKRVSITLSGDVAGREVRLSSTGSLFTVENGVTLNVENLTLVGREDNNQPLVRVGAGGEFVLKSGMITRNNNTTDTGGGVRIDKDATFTMEGGAISGNTVTNNDSSGGGVQLLGNFTMKGGKISGNTAGRGGGVYGSSSGTFIAKKGGTIYGSNASNTLKNTATSGNGYAVLLGGGGKRRNTDAGPEIKLYAKHDGSAWTYNDTSASGVGDTTAEWE
jgi:predicted small secreted protein